MNYPIITVTFNPAVDKSTTVPALIPEKKLRCSRPSFEPGGGGINVARALKKLGRDATAIFLEGGYTGQFLFDLLRKEQVHSLPVHTREHTRENLVVLETDSGLQYRFGMPGPKIDPAEWAAVADQLRQSENPAMIVVSGSIPEGVPEDFMAVISGVAKEKGAKLIADSSGPALQQALQQGVYLVKPNLGELSYLTGHKELRGEEVPEAARQLIHRFGCAVVVVSMGAAGALLVTNTVTRQFIPPVVKIKSTVGAGDSMVAGIVFGLSGDMDVSAAVKYGVACGTAATLNPGTALCNREDADNLFSAIRESE